VAEIVLRPLGAPARDGALRASWRAARAAGLLLVMLGRSGGRRWVVNTLLLAGIILSTARVTGYDP